MNNDFKEEIPRHYDNQRASKGMNFSKALEAIKENHRLCRVGWPTGAYIKLHNGTITMFGDSELWSFFANSDDMLSEYWYIV